MDAAPPRITSLLILQSVVKLGSHGCVGLAEDAQVLLTFNGSDITGCRRAGRKTSVTHRRHLRRLGGALRSCRG